MRTVIEEVRVPIRTEFDVVTARQRGREMAAESGFGLIDQVATATAISELARNIILYASTGEVLLRRVVEAGKFGVMVVAHDEGPGIPDIAKVMQGGYTTSGGLGLGLSGTKRLMDEFDIVSEVGKGTTVTTTKWRR